MAAKAAAGGPAVGPAEKEKVAGEAEDDARTKPASCARAPGPIALLQPAGAAAERASVLPHFGHVDAQGSRQRPRLLRHLQIAEPRQHARDVHQERNQIGPDADCNLGRKDVEGETDHFAAEAETQPQSGQGHDGALGWVGGRGRVGGSAVRAGCRRGRGGGVRCGGDGGLGLRHAASSRLNRLAHIAHHCHPNPSPARHQLDRAVRLVPAVPQPAVQSPNRRGRYPQAQAQGGHALGGRRERPREFRQSEHLRGIHAVTEEEQARLDLLKCWECGAWEAYEGSGSQPDAERRLRRGGRRGGGEGRGGGGRRGGGSERRGR
eukprot:scaffold3015_cov78-Isochrysis_galbana.AAC.4